jgi:hypothetical protein
MLPVGSLWAQVISSSLHRQLEVARGSPHGGAHPAAAAAAAETPKPSSSRWRPAPPHVWCRAQQQQQARQGCRRGCTAACDSAHRHGLFLCGCVTCWEAGVCRWAVSYCCGLRRCGGLRHALLAGICWKVFRSVRIANGCSVDSCVHCWHARVRMFGPHVVGRRGAAHRQLCLECWLYSTVQCSTAPYSTLQYSTVHDSTILGCSTVFSWQGPSLPQGGLGLLGDLRFAMAVEFVS